MEEVVGGPAAWRSEDGRRQFEAGRDTIDKLCKDLMKLGPQGASSCQRGYALRSTAALPRSMSSHGSHYKAVPHAAPQHDGGARSVVRPSSRAPSSGRSNAR